MGIFNFNKSKNHLVKIFKFSHYVVDFANHEKLDNVDNLPSIIDRQRFDLDLKVYIIDENDKYGLYLIDLFDSDTLANYIRQNHGQFLTSTISLTPLQHDKIVTLIENLLYQLQSQQNFTTWQDFDSEIAPYMLPLFFSPENLPDPNAPQGYQAWRHRWEK